MPPPAPLPLAQNSGKRQGGISACLNSIHLNVRTKSACCTVPSTDFANRPSGTFRRRRPASNRLVDFSDPGTRMGIVTNEKVTKSDEEWKKQLTPEQFAVTRKKGTEMAFTGKYYKTHDRGMYRCACCGNPLFSSDTKFESGTGWPSFWSPIDQSSVLEESDASHGMRRTEVLCSKCDAHLGHVFPDGPKPTGLRYCMNSASLDFVKQEGSK